MSKLVKVPSTPTPTDGMVPTWTGGKWVPTSSGASAAPADGSVTLAKLANLAQDQFIGRTTASTGVPETATITAAARTVLDDTTVGAMLTTLGGAAVANVSTQKVGLTATNGAAATAMRSDGAPALDVSIAPTWTGVHTYSLAEPRLILSESDQGADLKAWDIDVNGAILTLRTRTDADGAGKDAIKVTRGTTTAISNISLGNATDNPTMTWLGTGAATFGGAISATAATISTLRVNLAGNTGTAPTNAGIYPVGSNRLGFAATGAYCGEFDASGNFIAKFGRADQSKSVQVPTTGFSITVGNNSSALILNPAGTLATGTITMPATPIDGQIIRFSSSQTITALTVSANTGQTISGAPTTMGAATPFSYMYHLAGTNWYRV